MEKRTSDNLYNNEKERGLNVGEKSFSLKNKGICLCNYKRYDGEYCEKICLGEYNYFGEMIDSPFSVIFPYYIKQFKKTVW